MPGDDEEDSWRAEIEGEVGAAGIYVDGSVECLGMPMKVSWPVTPCGMASVARAAARIFL